MKRSVTFIISSPENTRVVCDARTAVDSLHGPKIFRNGFFISLILYFFLTCGARAGFLGKIDRDGITKDRAEIFIP